jgi:hypothetical protein
MIDHVWTVVCSRAVVDQFSNNVSLEGVLEQLTVPAVPTEGLVLPIELHLMTLWARSDFDVPSVGQYRFVLRAPSGAVARGPFDRPVNLSEHKRVRDRVTIRGMPLDEAGRYSFEIDLRAQDDEHWVRAATIPIEVVFQPPDDAGPPDEDSR